MVASGKDAVAVLEEVLDVEEREIDWTVNGGLPRVVITGTGLTGDTASVAVVVVGTIASG